MVHANKPTKHRTLPGLRQVLFGAACRNVVVELLPRHQRSASSRALSFSSSSSSNQLAQPDVYQGKFGTEANFAGGFQSQVIVGSCGRAISQKCRGISQVTGWTYRTLPRWTNDSRIRVVY